MTHTEYADSLRELAKFWEQHEEIPLPGDCESFAYYRVNEKESMGRLVKAFGSCEKQYSDSLMTIVKDFGAIKFRASAFRERFCEAIIVGKKVIPEEIIPGRPSEVIPEHEEDIIEWRCDESLLAP